MTLFFTLSVLRNLLLLLNPDNRPCFRSTFQKCLYPAKKSCVDTRKSERLPLLIRIPRIHTYFWPHTSTASWNWWIASPPLIGWHILRRSKTPNESAPVASPEYSCANRKLPLYHPLGTILLRGWTTAHSINLVAMDFPRDSYFVSSNKRHPLENTSKSCIKRRFIFLLCCISISNAADDC